MSKSSFDKLLNKLKILEDTDIVDIIVDRIAERGIEIANQEYAGIEASLRVDNIGKGQREIVASGEGLSYIEFGTGLTGQGTYQGNLPTETRTFESPKNRKPPAIQSTQGWEYNYKNDLTKRGNGWYYNKSFTTGKIAQAQMFNTATQLKKETGEIVKNVLKGEI